MIKITDGKNTTKKYKTELKKLGLTFKPTGQYTGYWYTNDDSRQRELLKFCNKRKLIIEQEDSRFSRSAKYREDFFRANKGYKRNGKDYHCAYCGKKLKKQKLEVDHVIAVDAVKKRLLPKLFIILTGIKNVNDPKNLVASCRRCNRKKSNKQGLWVIRGYLGRNIWFWRILRILILAILIFGIVYLYQEGYFTPLILELQKGVS